ncbi:nuclear ribonuclease Z [Medicago truncatula]|uniref:Nuclear ribonuclease Z n=1 Tax=Medicago truncatula TaxID=3880 RepID=A0A072VGH0_MEDTR|nr:nuclear ribonuclease Z [Medicago truncatula]
MLVRFKQVALSAVKLTISISGHRILPCKKATPPPQQYHSIALMELRTEKSSETESKKKSKGLNIEGYQVEGLSIGGHETCVIFSHFRVAFDIGRCPPRAVSMDFLLISHAHMDHIGGLPMYVATRGLYRMKPPTIIVPISVKEDVEKLFEIHRKMDQSELKHNLVGLDVGEEFSLRHDLKVKAFRTYHVIPSQGYILYSVKNKLKPEYIGLSSDEIKKLKFSGVEITNTLKEPEIAFTGDTMSDFIIDENNTDVLRAKVLVLEVIHFVQYLRRNQVQIKLEFALASCSI